MPDGPVTIFFRTISFFNLISPYLLIWLFHFVDTYPTAIEQSAIYSDGMMYDIVVVEFSQNGTFRSTSCRPGANVMPAAMAPNNSIIAYIKRVDVEFLHDGQAAQHNEHAVPVQQQANYRKISFIQLTMAVYVKVGVFYN